MLILTPRPPKLKKRAELGGEMNLFTQMNSNEAPPTRRMEEPRQKLLKVAQEK